MPFGEEIPASVGSRAAAGYEISSYLKQKFTGKERDEAAHEAGFDCFLARYYSSPLGRFATPDAPFADQSTDDPQSWNLYAYGRNNPLRHVDPTGESLWDVLDGLSNAVVSNNALGFGRRTGNSDFAFGQAAGDAFSVIQGVVETAVGATSGGAGVVACGTGVGCVAGAPATVIGAAVAVHGATVVTSGVVNLMKGTGPKAGDGPPDDKNKIDQRKSQSDIRATKSEKNTLDGAKDQRESISHAQSKLRRHGQGEKIRSIKKSEQREQHQLDRIKTLKDAERP